MNTVRLNFQEGDLPSVHPHNVMVYLRGLSIAKTLYEGLTRVDSQGKAQLSGAISYEVSPDQLHYTFTLRDHCWSDGSPVTAYQYEASWKEALAPNSTCPRAELLYILKNGREAKKEGAPLDSVGVKALDAKTLALELAYPTPFLLELLAQPVCFPLADPSNREPTLFNGGFVVDHWEKGTLLRLKPNPHFWDRKRVGLDQIDVYIIQDVNTAYSFYNEKKLDWIGVPLCPLTSEQIGNLMKKDQIKTHAIDRAFWVFLNANHPILSSPTIRRALGQAVDRKQITTHILLGGKPLVKPLPDALLPDAVSGAFVAEDLALAKRTFERGLQEMGLKREDLPPLTIKYAQQANRKQLAEYLSQSWSEAFGIEVRPQLEEWNTLRTNLAQGNFEICGAFDAAFYKDPLEPLERLASLNSGNFSQWIDPVYAEKIQTAKTERDVNKRMKLLGEAEVILMKEMPFIPICSDQFLFSHAPGLQGYAFDYVGAIDFTYASYKKP